MRMMMCILENNDNDLCFVNLLFCQVSIWLDIRLIWETLISKTCPFSDPWYYKTMTMICVSSICCFVRFQNGFQQMQGPLGSAPKPVKTRFRGADSRAPAKSLSDRGILQILVSALLRFRNRIGRLFCGFRPFAGTARDALSGCSNNVVTTISLIYPRTLYKIFMIRI